MVQAAERLLEAALRGDVRTLVISAVNPLHHAEIFIAGDLSLVRRDVLVGSLGRAVLQLAQQEG